MKTTDELLKSRHTTMLEWVELWPGITADGEDIRADVSQRATVDDCIAIARHAAIKAHGVPPDDPRLQDDAKMLDEFRIIHWAHMVEDVEQKTTDLVWRPASTAPKDGTEFQGWFVSQDGSGSWEPFCSYNKKGELGRWYEDYDGWDYDLSHLTLTHWMPQPEAPTEQEE